MSRKLSSIYLEISIMENDNLKKISIYGDKMK